LTVRKTGTLAVDGQSETQKNETDSIYSYRCSLQRMLHH